MTHILAVKNKPSGRGQYRCYRGWLFNTIIQSKVEDFMIDIGQDDYFLINPDELHKDDVGNFIIHGIWVWLTEVDVQTRELETNYLIKR